MTSREIREKFLNFFKEKGHEVIPSSSLIPEGDSSTLFTTAGMQPLVPYLLGEDHPKGKRLANTQKCIRTGDIDEVGDNTHLTFFEMLGNWSLGDYWKKEAIEWSYEFLTNEEKGLGIDPERLYITIFGGEEGIPKDEEAKGLWVKVGVSESRIYNRGMKDNFWSPGDNGPCGPSTEMFVDITENGLGDLTPEEFEKADEEQRVVEIWNDVFMEYKKKDGKVVGELKQKNVDTGMGLERVTAMMNGVETAYDTDLFSPILEVIPEGDNKARRIMADHMRAVTFAVADGVEPGNTDRGYVVRRLLRRSMRYGKELGLGSLIPVIDVIIKQYSDTFPELNKEDIKSVIKDEEERFNKTLEKGLREFEKIEGDISGKVAFDLYQTYGFPLELTLELAQEKGWKLDIEEFKKAEKEHQERSRTAAVGKFKGGLADHNEATVKLHTAHHLLLAALQKVLGEEVKQRGSNITTERLRIDFTFDRKMTDEEKQEVEKLVNDWISRDMKVVRREMPLEEAKRTGAEMEFGAKYPDKVSVYFIEDKDGNVISKEFCAGPHVEHTGVIGEFHIKKEEASSKGVRRIKGVISK